MSPTKYVKSPAVVVAEKLRLARLIVLEYMNENQHYTSGTLNALFIAYGLTLGEDLDEVLDALVAEGKIEATQDEE